MPCAFCYMYDDVCEMCGEKVDTTNRPFTISTSILKTLLSAVVRFDSLACLLVDSNGWKIKVIDPNKVMMAWFGLPKNKFDIYPGKEAGKHTINADKFLALLKSHDDWGHVCISFEPDNLVVSYEGYVAMIPISKEAVEPEHPTATIEGLNIEFVLEADTFVKGVKGIRGLSSSIIITNKGGFVKMQAYGEIGHTDAVIFQVKVHQPFTCIYGAELLETLVAPLTGSVSIRTADKGALLVKTEDCGFHYTALLGPRVEDDD